MAEEKSFSSDTHVQVQFRVCVATCHCSTQTISNANVGCERCAGCTDGSRILFMGPDKDLCNESLFRTVLLWSKMGGGGRNAPKIWKCNSQGANCNQHKKSRLRGSQLQGMTIFLCKKTLFCDWGCKHACFLCGHSFYSSL